MQNELKPCNCNKYFPFVYDTNFLGKRLFVTIICIGCGKTARGRTFEKAVNAWNRRVDNER